MYTEIQIQKTRCIVKKGELLNDPKVGLKDISISRNVQTKQI